MAESWSVQHAAHETHIRRHERQAMAWRVDWWRAFMESESDTETARVESGAERAVRRERRHSARSTATTTGGRENRRAKEVHHFAGAGCEAEVAEPSEEEFLDRNIVPSPLTVTLIADRECDPSVASCSWSSVACWWHGPVDRAPLLRATLCCLAWAGPGAADHCTM